MNRTTVPCPFCNKELHVHPELTPGCDVRCPSCDRVFQIPDSSPSAPPRPAPSGAGPGGIAPEPGAGAAQTERVPPDVGPERERWRGGASGAPAYDEDPPPRFYRNYDDEGEGRTAPLSNQ